MIEFIHDQCMMDHDPIMRGIHMEAPGRYVEAVELECGLYGIAIHNRYSNVEPTRFQLREKTFMMLYAAMTRLIAGDPAGGYEIAETFFEGEFLKPTHYYHIEGE